LVQIELVKLDGQWTTSLIWTAVDKGGQSRRVDLAGIVLDPDTIAEHLDEGRRALGDKASPYR
jgi:hypothetical protein